MLFGLYISEIWNTEVWERNHWNHHVEAHLTSDCMAQYLWTMENWGRWCAWETTLVFNNYAVNSACQHCGFFPIFLVTVRCVTQSNRRIKNYVLLLVQYSCEISCTVAQPLWSYEIILICVNIYTVAFFFFKNLQCQLFGAWWRFVLGVKYYVGNDRECFCPRWKGGTHIDTLRPMEGHYTKQFSTNNIYREHCNKDDGKKASD